MKTPFWIPSPIGHIRYAGLDVFEKEPDVRSWMFWGIPPSVQHPIPALLHLEAQERIGLEMAQRILEHFPMG